MLLVSVMYCSSVCRVFFFFKQKTAYDMRISDWSSDVCSSDLLYPVLALLAIFRICALPRHERWVGLQTCIGLPGVLSPPLDEFWIHRAAEIGRASCRERVCQYV